MRALRRVFPFALVALLAMSLVAGCTRSRPRPASVPPEPTARAMTPTAALAPTPTFTPIPAPPTPTATAQAAPAPAPTMAPTPTPVSPAPAISGAGQAATYVVQRGDTLFSIARRLGTDVATLRQLNNLASDAIAVGQVLKVPGGAGAPVPTSVATVAPTPAGQVREHIVQRGEYLATIAAKYGVTVNAIIQANALRNPNLLTPGQKLIIPATGAAPTPATGTATPSATRVHVVARGETLQSIARQYGVTVQALISANQITNPNLIQVGQKLVIP
jgi:LysM repeat protein